nr:MAG TPA: hypothetical protein [Caudoviricetes sp.]
MGILYPLRRTARGYNIPTFFFVGGYNIPTFFLAFVLLKWCI